MARFTATVEVRFGEVDRAGIVYYPRFFHFFHVAFEEFFARRVGVPYPVLIDERRTGFPTVRAECDFEAPLRFGDRVAVSVAVERVGRTSVVFRYEARVRRRRAAAGRLTVVCVDMDTFRPRSIPADCRRAFERHRLPSPAAGLRSRRQG